MHAVILTFPGHFFQTQLCVQSLLKHYPEVIKLSFVLDDVQSSPWSRYRIDFADAVSSKIYIPSQTLYCSDMPKINSCVAGWWRQQLVKLTLDRILPDDEWFVVDGDVIFQSRCEVQNRVPIAKKYDLNNRWNKMCELYVKGVLGTTQGIMLYQDQPVVTSAIPFRYLSRELLSDLRHHVQCRWNNDFVDLHLAWFQDQTIVADIDPPTRWVMSEWELIECFRRLIQQNLLPYQDLGSGYQLDACVPADACQQQIFLHSYQRDPEIGRRWFEDQGLIIDDSTWQQSLCWYNDREMQKLS